MATVLHSVQIENEYGSMEKYYGKAGYQYMLSTAKFALSQNIGVPWVMCVQPDAPQDMINTCNGFYCDQWIAEHVIKNPTQPHFWTEVRTGNNRAPLYIRSCQTDDRFL